MELFLLFIYNCLDKLRPSEKIKFRRPYSDGLLVFIDYVRYSILKNLNKYGVIKK